MRDRIVLGGFLLLVVGGGAGIGVVTGPGEWYASLTRPAITPPSWVFGPVWTTLYILIAVAGWRTYRRHSHGRGMTLWWLQLLLNFLWSPTFFALHRIGWALVVITLLCATIAAFLFVTRRHDPLSTWLMAPYAAWVAFAAVLNAEFLRLNGPGPA